MIATLTFNLPEEQSEFRTTCNADKLYGALWDLDQKLRGYLKHGHKFKSVEDLAEHLREQIPYELLEEDV